MSSTPQVEQKSPVRFNYDFTPEPQSTSALPAATPSAPAAAPAATPRFNYDFTPEPESVVPKPQLRLDPKTRFNYDFKPEPESASPKPQITPEPATSSKRSFWTSSVFGEAPAKWLSSHIASAIDPILPKDAEGKNRYLSTVFEDISSKAPAGLADFLTSPAGGALTIAHMVPALAPVAAGVDIGLGAYAGVSSLGSIINFAQDYKDPHKLAQMLIDVGTTAMLVRGGARYKSALEKVPADVRAGTPLLKATYDALKTPPPPLPEARFVKGKALYEQLKAAEPEDRQAVLEQAAQPTSLAEQFRMKLWKAPETAKTKIGAGAASVARSIASILGVERPALYDLGAYLLDERQKFIGRGAIETARFTRDLQDMVPDSTERGIQKMGYVMEKSATPEEVGMSAEGQAGSTAARQFQRETDRILHEGYNGQVSLRDAESYLTHVWDFRGTEGASKLNVSRASMRDRYLQGRTIATYREGIEGEHKLTPLYDDVATVLAKRRMTAVVTLANQKFANTLRDLGAVMDPAEARQAGVNWDPVKDAPALHRAVYAGKTKTGDDIFRYDPPVVNPDIRMAVEAVFQKPFQSPTLAAVEQVRAFGKQNNVNFSLFHHMAIGEVAQAELATRPTALISGLFSGGKELWKGMVAGYQEAHGKTPSYAPPIVSWPRELVDRHAGRLYFQTAEHEWQITEALRKAPPRDAGVLTRVLNPPFRELGNVSYMMNRSLFDFFQQGLMIKSADKLYMDWLGKNPNATPEQISNFLDVADDHVNRGFGAQNLESLMLSPNTRRFMNMLMFAPVWTIGNIRTVTAGYDTITGKSITNKYLASAFATWFTTTQLANYALTGWFNMKDKNGKAGAHFTWDNGGAPLKLGATEVPNLTENFFNIGFGHNANGTERYFRFGKPYRELPNWFNDPLGTAQAKTGRLLGLAAVAFTGSEPGGYKVWDRNASPEQKAWVMLGQGLDFATPFAAHGLLQAGEHYVKPRIFPQPMVTTQFLGVPTRQGINISQAVDRYRQAKEEGREDIAAKVLDAARQNNIAPRQIVMDYLRGVKIGDRMEMERPTYTPMGEMRTAQPPRR